MSNQEKLDRARADYKSAIVDYHSLDALKIEAELHEKAGESPTEAFKISAAVLRERIRLAELPLKSSIQMVRGQELPEVTDQQLPE